MVNNLRKDNNGKSKQNTNPYNDGKENL